MNETGLEKRFVENTGLLFFTVNVFVFPNYIVTKFLCRKFISKLCPPSKKFGIKLKRDCKVFYIIIAVKYETFR